MGDDVLFVLFGIKFTLPLIITIVGGTLTGLLTLYKLVERWSTREQRRLNMLRDYVDREEKNISARRRVILASIRTSQHSFLADRHFDVGAEIDRAIEYLDEGYPDRAGAALAELERRLIANERILRKRADDLERHTASVHIFLAALSERMEGTSQGIEYIDKAIQYDGNDPDALKIKGMLLLRRGDLNAAEVCYDRLRTRANGPENSTYRADAHYGLSRVHFSRGAAHFKDALRALTTALQNLNAASAKDRDYVALSQIYMLQAEILKADGWDGFDRPKAVAAYRAAVETLRQLPKRRSAVEATIAEVEAEIGKLATQ